MNYELAKKLKDAGFPLELYPDTEDSIQQDKNINVFKKPLRSIVRIDYVYFYFPTLPELIEACGKYIKLWKTPEGWNATKSNGKNETQKLKICFGFTTEEAVANLWLEINKK